MATLAEIIRADQDTIIASWKEEARRSASGRDLEEPALQNMISMYLLALAEAGDELGRCTGRQRDALEAHLSSRLRQGYQLAEIVEEFALLGRCIARIWNGNAAQRPSPAEIEKLFEELHQAAVAVSDIFQRHMMEDEQTDKRYLRLIQSIASESLQNDRPAFKERLKDVLSLIAEAMHMPSAALLLYNIETEEMEFAAAAGMASEVMEHYVSSIAPRTFAGRVASDEMPTEVWDAVTTELELNDRLRGSGLRSLLGVRLPAQHQLVGVVFVGLPETRRFTAREKRRLEVLGAQLTVHLYNAKLYAELRRHVDQLESERALRERFVSVLAHDLRGPLSAAKLSAEILAKHPEELDERRTLAASISRNIDRTDRMIRALLDANRIRAGQRLPLRINRCDLSAVAREVREELVAVVGPRVVVDAKDSVVGFWSSEELRRAIWNLVTNAAKYGAKDLPITITVARTLAGVQLAVHNWGPPIPSEDQEKLFRPFSRTHAAEIGGQPGWGLGLTLVCGCAAAHGGRVRLDSSREAGTTFSLELPEDARPFQPRPESAAAETSASTSLLH